MTKEQEEAIEMLENIENNPWTTKYIMSSDSKKAETVLNMIKEKDKEIERLRYIKNSFDYVVQKETEKKDKTIDLMAEIFYKKFKAELLLEYGFEGEEQLKQYFKEIAERKSEEC